LTETEADDVLQETALAVVKHIKAFKYDPKACSFKSWLLLITRQRIIWQLRKRPSERLGQIFGAQARETSASQAANDGTRTATIERVPDPGGSDLDVLWEVEWQKNLMATALEAVKQEVSLLQ